MLDRLAIFSGEAGRAGARYRWRHFRRSADVEAALAADPELPEFVRRALLEKDTLPRMAAADDHVLLILRGVGPGAPEAVSEMPSLRLYFHGTEIISVELSRLAQVDQMIARFEAGHAPDSPNLFVLDLVRGIRHSIEPVLDRIDNQITEFELSGLNGESARVAKGASHAARQARLSSLQLLRFMAPQSHAIEALLGSGADWLSSKRRLREEAAAFHRIAADLEALRARAQILAEDELRSVTARTNTTILMLSVVSVVFLPLTFMTGLFGVNLAGIPGADRPWAFPALSVMLIVAAGVAIWLARRLLR